MTMAPEQLNTREAELLPTLWVVGERLRLRRGMMGMNELAPAVVLPGFICITSKALRGIRA